MKAKQLTEQEITVAIKKNMDKIVKICKDNGIDYLSLCYLNDDNHETVMFNNNYYHEGVGHKIDYAEVKEKHNEGI